MSRRAVLAGAVGVVAGGCAPGASPGRSLSPGAFAIEGAMLFDGERALGPGTVIADRGRIVEVGPGTEVPTGLAVHDGRGKTVLPGLIDCHVHVSLERRDAPRFGVTTELDMFAFPDGLGDYRAQRRSLAPTDQSDLWTAGMLATVPGGHGTEYGPVPTLAPDAGLRAADEFVAERLAEGSDYIKIIMEDGRLYGGSLPTLSPKTVRALIRAAHDRDAMAVVHVARQRDAAIALEGGADGLAHVPGDPVTGRTVDVVSRSGGFVIPTLSVYGALSCTDTARSLLEDPLVGPLLSTGQREALKQRFDCLPRIFPAAQDNVRALHGAGVPILAGTDTGNPGVARGASLLAELELLVEAGLTPVESLRAATALPTRLFSLGDRGRLAPEHRADLVLVNGDATREISAVRDIDRVWRNGRLIDRRP